MTLLWLISFIAGHEASILNPVNAWTATLILAVGSTLHAPGTFRGPVSVHSLQRWQLGIWL
jgi:hypothetical protein